MASPRWSINGTKEASLPVQPPAFDMFLRSIGVSEQDAPRSAQVRAWIKLNRRSRYVPLTVMQELGYGTDCD